MAEVGLLPSGRIHLQVPRAALPCYRSRFSRCRLIPPEFLAILCLMRYEDFTLRLAEARLSEHRELRKVLRRVSVPDFKTLYRFLQRLNEQTIDRAVGETLRRLRGSLRREWRRTENKSVGVWGVIYCCASPQAERSRGQSTRVEEPA